MEMREETLADTTKDPNIDTVEREDLMGESKSLIRQADGDVAMVEVWAQLEEKYGNPVIIVTDVQRVIQDLSPESLGEGVHSLTPEPPEECRGYAGTS